MNLLIAFVLIVLGFVAVSAGVFDFVRSIFAHGPACWDIMKRGLFAILVALFLLASGGYFLETSSSESAIVLLVVTLFVMAAILIAVAVWNASWAPFSSAARSASVSLFKGAIVLLLLVFAVLVLRDRPLSSAGGISHGIYAGDGLTLPNMRLDRLWPHGTFAGFDAFELWLLFMITGLVVFGINRAPLRKLFWIPVLATLGTMLLCR